MVELYFHVHFLHSIFFLWSLQYSLERFYRRNRHHWEREWVNGHLFRQLVKKVYSDASIVIGVEAKEKNSLLPGNERWQNCGPKLHHFRCVCPSVCAYVRPSVRPSVRLSVCSSVTISKNCRNSPKRVLLDEKSLLSCTDPLWTYLFARPGLFLFM